MAKTCISMMVPCGKRYGPMRTSFTARRNSMGSTGLLRIDSCFCYTPRTHLSDYGMTEQKSKSTVSRSSSVPYIISFGLSASHAPQQRSCWDSSTACVCQTAVLYSQKTLHTLMTQFRYVSRDRSAYSILRGVGLSGVASRPSWSSSCTTLRSTSGCWEMSYLHTQQCGCDAYFFSSW